MINGFIPARFGYTENMRRTILILLIFLMAVSFLPGCRRNRSESFVMAISDSIQTLDPMGGANVDLGSERMRQLLFNSLVRKNEKLEYVGELASDIVRSEDGLTYTFTLRDGVKFHDGRPLTAADAKYTLDTLLASSSAKAASYFEGTGAGKRSFITGVEARDPRTLVVNLSKPWLQLLVNLVPIGIIPAGSASTQAERPLGSGPFKFKAFNKTQQVLELEANTAYWEGPPHIGALRIVVMQDASTLQAEILSGRVDLAPNITNITPDAFNSLASKPDLKVEQLRGANIVYLGFNTRAAPLDNVRVRQAISYAIDREAIIRNLLLGQAQLAHSILPEQSWAYMPGQKYAYDPAKAKKLLDEAGFTDPDGDGPRLRFEKPIVFKLSASSVATRQYSVVIQDYLKQVGIPIEIETLEGVTLTDQQVKGNYQMITRTSVGGNQDPIFLRDLFATSGIPTPDRVGFNRTRYSNPELDPLLEEAVNTADQEKAKSLYARAQEIVSRDVPMFPLWYPNIMVVARRNVGNIKIKPDGDFSFAREITVSK